MHFLVVGIVIAHMYEGPYLAEQFLKNMEERMKQHKLDFRKGVEEMIVRNLHYPEKYKNIRFFGQRKTKKDWGELESSR